MQTLGVIVQSMISRVFCEKLIIRKNSSFCFAKSKNMLQYKVVYLNESNYSLGLCIYFTDCVKVIRVISIFNNRRPHAEKGYGESK